MSDDIKFLAWHSVGSDDYQETIKQIIKRGFLLPASMRSGKTCKIQIEDYLAGDAPFVFMHIQGFNEIHQENEFMSGYNTRNFYFDAVELIELGAILRDHDLLYKYKQAIQKETNKAIRKYYYVNWDREQTAKFIEYAAYQCGVDVKCRDTWVLTGFSPLANDFRHALERLQAEHKVGEMFDKIYKECLRIRGQHELVGSEAIDMVEKLHNEKYPVGNKISNAELIWEGPLPVYLALHDSPAFKAVR